jgi:putative transposase
MALSESALSELLVALTDRERGVDLVRELAQYLAQELIEVQATETIGAARYERSDERVTERNGHRDRVLTTKAGDLELAIPKLRKGSFFPSILEPRRRTCTSMRSTSTCVTTRWVRSCRGRSLSRPV